MTSPSRRRVNSKVMVFSVIRITVVLLLGFPVAHACICLQAPTVSESFAKAAVVFEGTVIAHGRYGAWLRVDKSWKGVSSRKIYLYTGNLRNDCEPSFGKRGERWLVYVQLTPLYHDQNSKTPYTRKLMAQGCDRTVVFAGAAKDLRALAALRR